MRDDEIDMVAVRATLEAAIKEAHVVPPVPSAPPKAKVVDMRGQPTLKLSNRTHPRIYEILDELRDEIAKEPCMAIVIAFVDGGGRVGTKLFYEAGYGHHAISGASIAHFRTLAKWENNLDLVGPTDGSS